MALRVAIVGMGNIGNVHARCYQQDVLFKNGVVGHLTGSYDAGGGFGLERCEVTGSKGRFVLEDAIESWETRRVIDL